MSVHEHLPLIHNHDVIGIIPQIILIIPFLIALIAYIVAVFISNRKYRHWSLYRTLSWVVGIVIAVVAVSGPVAERAHVDFTAHMLGHLFLGMLAPLLLVLAAPMTLLMRTLNVTLARQLSRLLKTVPVRIINDPIVATLLNVGGLWVLYTTDLYSAMHENLILHVFIHVHVFLAGFFFTLSMIYIDPTPHQTSYVYRSIILVFAMAAHGILSKYIYVNPPSGVSLSQAERGGKLMYYGGDAIEILLILILCVQWYKASRPRHSLVSDTYSIS